jgi:hypothetical protein
MRGERAAATAECCIEGVSKERVDEFSDRRAGLAMKAVEPATCVPIDPDTGRAVRHGVLLFSVGLVTVGGSGGVPRFATAGPRADGEIAGEVEHEPNLFDRGLSRGRRECSKIVLERVKDGIGGAFPRRDLVFDGGAEEIALRDAIDGEELLELDERHRRDAIAGFKRREGLLPDAGALRNLTLGEVAEVPQLAELQDKVQARPPFKVDAVVKG